MKGSFADGEYDEDAIVGENLYTTLDVDLQEYAYELMQNKKAESWPLNLLRGNIGQDVQSRL